MAVENSLEQRTGILYNGVVFEPKAFDDGTNKKSYTFDQSLERLQQAGFERHPRLQEVLSLLIANIENKLTPEQKAVVDDMLDSYGEWLSVAMERHGDTITVYTDPEGLVWNGSSKYVKQDFKSSSKQDFSVSGIPSQIYVDLNRFGNDLVEFFYTRPFNDLPQQIQKYTMLQLPPDGQIWPAGRDVFSDYGLDCFDYDGRASRGVRVEK